MTRSRTITQTIGSVGLLIGLGTAAAPVAGDCDIWSAFGGGAGVQVYSVIEYEGDLVILGTFSTVDGMQIPGIAAWDGTSWYPLGDGLLVALIDGEPQVGVFDGDLVVTGELIPNSVGFYQPAFRWDGSAWDTFGDQQCDGAPSVGSLTIYEGDLIVGLRLTGACEHHTNGFDDPISGVLRWNGEYWSQVGDTSDFHRVRALTVFEGDLIAGDDLGAIRRWDGESWELIGQMDDQILTFTEYNGDLITGGRFTEADGLTVNQIARWTGEHWVAMAGGVGGVSDPRVNTLVVFNDELIAGGDFTSAGGQSADNIARWTGAGWEEFEGGANNRVHAAAPFGDGLAVGGSFTSLGGVSATRVGMFTPCLGPPIGACCVNGNCIEVDEQFCATIGGAYLGDETFCDDTDCPPACPADLNSDGVVDVLDLLMVLEAWGACPD
ncbi:MAG: hypothetical protein EA377_09755 [Phycisphaerales bacterium]|nr:MAG: hypothetical protein EA377_09755 [Phycisphaerales bacterium]